MYHKNSVIVMSNGFVNENFVDFLLTMISIIIAVIAIIISTYYARRSYVQSIKEEFYAKREILFSLFNDFLLYLESITNAKQYGLIIRTTNTKIDSLCLEAIGKINCFTFRNNLLDKNKVIIDNFISRMLKLSNEIQETHAIKDHNNQLENLKRLSEEIRELRSDILKEINDFKFFKEQKNKRRKLWKT